MSAKQPEVSTDCCAIFPKLASAFTWKAFSDYPHVLALPCIRVGDTEWRVNYCPSCGAYVRGVNFDAGRLE